MGGEARGGGWWVVRGGEGAGGCWTQCIDPLHLPTSSPSNCI